MEFSLIADVFPFHYFMFLCLSTILLAHEQEN